MSDAVFQAATIPQPGFSDPSSDSQAVFRAILNAFSYPGRKFSITGPQDVPAALGSALAAVELTLFDIDTAVWHHPVLAQDESAMGYLLFHTGLKRCTELADADFVVATVDSMPALNELRTGSDLSPQESTTLVLDAREMTGAHNCRATGPGINGEIEFLMPETYAEFFEDWAANHQLFPRGVDLLIVDEHSVMALPRTTSLAIQEHKREA